MSWVSKYYFTWSQDYYKENQRKTFELVDSYLKKPPKRILDIGAGYARIPQLFQEKYGTELYLLDGEFTGESTRHNKFGSTDSMSYYAPLSDLRKHYDSQGMKYIQVDGNNIDISEDIKFDLITSYLSCGFHYPISTYYNLIKKHSNKDTVVIMDIRRKTLNHQGVDINIINVLNKNTGKFSKTHFTVL